MAELTMYNTPFFITDPISNNAFSFEQRENPRVYVPSRIKGSLDDVAVGAHTAFEEFDDDAKLHQCLGLKNLVEFPHPATGKPVVVVDCHNHVFYFWYEALHQGVIHRGIQLVHIDAHRDTREPETDLSTRDSQDLQTVFEYTNSTLNVGNYIPPAVREGVISNVISITGERELFSATIDSPYILNLDLDFWAQGDEYIDLGKTMAAIKPLLLGADLITIATSPYFIEQHRAITLLHQVMESTTR